jgi:glycerol-3-phosphate acyltransferase PlsY
MPFVSAGVIILGYLLGSIPTAYIAGSIKRGEDIRKLGGGNMGALNATRELGQVTGLIVLLVDILKGVAAVLIALFLVGELTAYLAGFAAIIGHCWPIFLKFRGGKGAATTIGVFFALSPAPFACAIPLMLIVIALTSNVTLGMGAGFIFFPLFLWLFDEPFSMIIYAILVSIFLAVRYASTFKRNLDKTGLRGFFIERNYKPWQTRRR